MLKSIHLQQVKGHKDSKLLLSPGLNVITGDTDAGKSTFSRAFNWLVTNQRGYNPRPWKHLKPKGPSKITVETVEGHVISRVKHTGINAYELDSEVFKALGSDVPEEVQNALRLGPVNIQAQKDAYYLLNDTPGQVAKEFNKIANLEKMDGAIQSIQSRKVSKTQDLDKINQGIEDAEDEVRSLEYVQYAHEELIRLEDKTSLADRKAVAISEVEETVDNFILAKENAEQIAPEEFFTDFESLQGREVDRYEVQNLAGLVKQLEIHKGIIDGFSRIGDMNDALDIIYAAQSDLSEARQHLAQVEDLVKACVKPDNPGWEGDIAYLQGQLADLQAARKEFDEIGRLTVSHDIQNNLICQIQISIDMNKATIIDLGGEFCSECGRTLDEIHLHS